MSGCRLAEKEGILTHLELNDELEDLITEGFEKAGFSDRITLHIGDCKETLARLGAQLSEAGPQMLYDLVYIDANKRDYIAYLDLLLPTLRPGTFIIADNTLWDGKVYDTVKNHDAQTLGLDAFNTYVAAHPRLASVILPLRDGLTLIRVD